METEASKLVREENIAVTKRGGNYPLYLVKLVKDPFETVTSMKDGS